MKLLKNTVVSVDPRWGYFEAAIDEIIRQETLTDERRANDLRTLASDTEGAS